MVIQNISSDEKTTDITFTVKRDDFNIQAGNNLEKVANQIEISLNVAGAHPF